MRAGAVPKQSEPFLAARDDRPGFARPDARIFAYLRILRVDHWIKNIFMLPGVAVGLLFVRPPAEVLALHIALGFASLCLTASANYTINEYLDAEFDRFHPTKKYRAGAQGLLDGRWVTVQYCALVTAGLSLAWKVGECFWATSAILLMMGVIYNVRPLRTKDRRYFDVLSEAINNPLRLLLGWFAVVSMGFPPSSTLLAYWMGGCFLMAVKRFTEYRSIGNPLLAGLYRRSFNHYTENSLLISAFFYAVCSSFFLAVFLIKYRIELLLLFPLLSGMFAWYLAIGLKKNSAAQAPERLFLEGRFMAFVLSLGVLAAVLFRVDIPTLHILLDPVDVH